MQRAATRSTGTRSGSRSFNSPYGTYSITDRITDLNEPKEIAYRAVRDAGLGTYGGRESLKCGQLAAVGPNGGIRFDAGGVLPRETAAVDDIA